MSNIDSVWRHTDSRLSMLPDIGEQVEFMVSTLFEGTVFMIGHLDIDGYTPIVKKRDNPSSDHSPKGSVVTAWRPRQIQNTLGDGI